MDSMDCVNVILLTSFLQENLKLNFVNLFQLILTHPRRIERNLFNVRDSFKSFYLHLLKKIWFILFNGCKPFLFVIKIVILKKFLE